MAYHVPLVRSCCVSLCVCHRARHDRSERVVITRERSTDHPHSRIPAVHILSVTDTVEQAQYIPTDRPRETQGWFPTARELPGVGSTRRRERDRDGRKTRVIDIHTHWTLGLTPT
jgi:hypothetical protein